MNAKALYSPIDFSGFMKGICSKNILYFLFMLPITFYYDVGLGVVEIADLCVASIIIVWLFRRKNSIREKRAFRSIQKPFNAFMLFNFWAIITIMLYGFRSNNLIAILFMLLKTLKVALYCFVVIVFIDEIVSKTAGYRYLMVGILFSLILHLPNQIYSTKNANDYQQKMMERYDRPVSMEAFGAKNSNGNLAVCYLLFLISIMKKKHIVTGSIIISLLLIMVLFSMSRGAWVVFVLGLFCLFTVLLKKNKTGNSPSRKRSNAVIVAGAILTGLLIYGTNSTYVKNSLLKPAYKDPITQEDTYTGGRMSLVKEALFHQINPIEYFIGRGYYSRFYDNEMWSYGAHNQFVQYIWEIGIVGLILFLRIFWAFYKISKPIENKTNRQVFSILLVMILLTGFSEIFFYGPTFIMAQFLLITYSYILFNKKSFGVLWNGNKEVGRKDEKICYR